MKREVLTRDYIYARSMPVPESGCWLWLPSWEQDGYGRLKASQQVWLAHRASWFAFNGPIPDGMDVLHRCDVRACVNPAHLFLGTNLDNVRDRMAKGRSCRGSRRANAKLTEDAIPGIRAAVAEGMSVAGVARDLGVDRSVVSRICSGRVWKHAV
jgi:hypothetical protein